MSPRLPSQQAHCHGHAARDIDRICVICGRALSSRPATMETVEPDGDGIGEGFVGVGVELLRQTGNDDEQCDESEESSGHEYSAPFGTCHGKDTAHHGCDHFVRFFMRTRLPMTY